MDEWGDSSENRMKFSLKIVDAVISIREKYNKNNFIIGYRLSPEEPYEDGIKFDETLKLIKQLSLKPIQFIHISQNNFFGKVHSGENEGSEKLKVIHNLTKDKVALIGVGGLKTENDINLAIKSGFCEFVAVGMASLLNKDFGMLLKEGKGYKLNLKFEPEHPEKYSLPKNLWDRFVAKK